MKDVRDKSHTTLHATLVAKCMARQCERREMYEDLKLQAGTDTSKVGRKTHKLLFETLEAGQKQHVLPGSDKYLFIVDESWEVNLSLNEAFCGCRQYIDTGLPCRHVAAAFLQPRKPGRSDFLPEVLSEYADPHYRLETLAKVYKEVVVPCAAGRDFLLLDGITLPQADVPQAGRPKKKKSHRGGSDKQFDQKKKAVSRCSRCHKVGHNSRSSCKEELELEQDGLVGQCEVEYDYKNDEGDDEDGAKGDDEEDEEDSWGDDDEEDAKEKEDDNGREKEEDHDEDEKEGVVMIFLSEDDTNSSDSATSPMPPPCKKTPKNQGKHQEDKDHGKESHKSGSTGRCPTCCF
jgi:hypothetical protein